MRNFVAACVAALGIIATPASANVHGCHYPSGHGPRNDPSMRVGNVTVRNMSCHGALTAISNSRLLRSGNISTPHFGCQLLKTYSPNGGRTILGADIRCSHRRPSKAFRFSWAT